MRKSPGTSVAAAAIAFASLPHLTQGLTGLGLAAEPPAADLHELPRRKGFLAPVASSGEQAGEELHDAFTPMDRATGDAECGRIETCRIPNILNLASRALAARSILHRRVLRTGDIMAPDPTRGLEEERSRGRCRHAASSARTALGYAARRSRTASRRAGSTRVRGTSSSSWAAPPSATCAPTSRRASRPTTSACWSFASRSATDARRSASRSAATRRWSGAPRRAAAARGSAARPSGDRDGTRHVHLSNASRREAVCPGQVPAVWHGARWEVSDRAAEHGGPGHLEGPCARDHARRGRDAALCALQHGALQGIPHRPHGAARACALAPRGNDATPAEQAPRQSQG